VELTFHYTDFTTLSRKVCCLNLKKLAFLDHLYTIDEQEYAYYKQHPEHAYSFEYIECYVWQSNSTERVCPLRDLVANAAEMVAVKEWYD
jgi:hypothetical protein